MSTKIVSGTASTRALTWSELDDILLAYSAQAENIARSHITRVLAFKSAHLHDRRVLGLDTGLPSDAVIDVMVKLAETVTKTIAGDERNPTYDIGCEVWIGYDRVTNRHLFNVFADLAAFKDAWLAIADVIVPFAYWNNSDRPDDISETEWNTRRETWDRVTSRNGGIWGSNGYVRTVIGKYSWPDPRMDEASLVDAGPSLDERVQRASELLAVGAPSAPRRGEGEAPWVFFRRTAQWLRSVEGRTACEEAGLRIRDQLATTRPFRRDAVIEGAK